MISNKDVLSEANRTNCMNLLNSIKADEFFLSKTQKKAAVLVPICQVNEELALLYTVRALHLKVNGGDIAFPGGMFSDSDGTLENTALRETHEEVGIVPDKVDVWGKGPEIHRQDVKVTPVLAYIGQLNVEKLKVNSSEVALAFTESLQNLSLPQNFHVTRFRALNNFVFQTPVYVGTRNKIWGLTAYITHIVLSSLIPDVYNKNITFRPKVTRVLGSRRKDKR